MNHIPELQAHHQGRDVLMVFETDIGSILADVSKYGEAFHLTEAARIIRRDMLNQKTRFSGAFPEGCLVESVPPSLLQFICMIEHGADIKSQLCHGASKSDLAISQLLQYNCFSKYNEVSKVHRHS